MPGIGACKMQTQFKSSKIVKTLKQYLNSELDLKTWKSQFSSYKKGKTRETILLAISLTGVSFQVPKKEKAERQLF